MNTFTSLKTTYTRLTNNTTATNITFGSQFINQFTMELLHKYSYMFSEQYFPTISTQPSQQYYQLPANLRKINTIQITVGNTVNNQNAGFSWPVKEAPSVNFWNSLNVTQNITSDIPQYYIVIDGKLGIYPKPANGYNPITISGQEEIVAMSIEDYTTGTIVSVPYTVTLTATPESGDKTATLSSGFALPTGSYMLVFSTGESRLCTITNGGTTLSWTEELTEDATTTLTIRSSINGDIVTGSGTTWAAYMEGLWIQINTTTGDYLYYKIDNFIDTTHISLTSPYTGSNISSGSATYTIGQVSLLPQAYQMIPVYRAVSLYYTVISKDPQRATMFNAMADGLEKSMRTDQGNKSTNPTVEDDYKPIVNPNLFINLTDPE